MIVWREQYVIDRGSERLAIITVALDIPSDEPKQLDGLPYLCLGSLTTVPLTPELRMTNWDSFMQKVHDAYRRQGWRWGADGRLHKES